MRTKKELSETNESEASTEATEHLGTFELKQESEIIAPANITKEELSEICKRADKEKKFSNGN